MTEAFIRTLMVNKAKKGLGRGLSALIPGADMEFLSRVARGEVSPAPIETATPSTGASATPSRTGSARATSRTLKSTAISDSTKSSSGTPDALSPYSAASTGVQQIALDEIEANPYQPRRSFSPGELEDLAASVREHGILQPILLRPGSGEKPFQLVAGERRWRAARAAGLAQVPAIVRDVADQQALELALIENVQRHDISALDAALAYKRLASEFALSQEQIASRVGKSRVAVANTIRLLDLPLEARNALEEGELSEGHGRAILLANGEAARRAVLRRILRERLSVRETEHFARQANESQTDRSQELNASSSDAMRGDSAQNASTPTSGAPTSGATATRGKNRESATGSASGGNAYTTDLRLAEQELQKRLGARLQVRPRARGGQIIIDYANAEDFERLFALFCSSTRISP